MKRVAVTLTDAEHETAQRESAKSEMTVAQWIAFLVWSYESPDHEEEE